VTRHPSPVPSPAQQPLLPRGSGCRGTIKETLHWNPDGEGQARRRAGRGQEDRWSSNPAGSCAAGASFSASRARPSTPWRSCASAAGRVRKGAPATDRAPQTPLPRTCLKGKSLCFAPLVFRRVPPVVLRAGGFPSGRGQSSDVAQSGFWRSRPEHRGRRSLVVRTSIRVCWRSPGAKDWPQLKDSTWGHLASAGADWFSRLPPPCPSCTHPPRGIPFPWPMSRRPGGQFPDRLGGQKCRRNPSTAVPSELLDGVIPATIPLAHPASTAWPPRCSSLVSQKRNSHRHVLGDGCPTAWCGWPRGVRAC